MSLVAASQFLIVLSSIQCNVVRAQATEDVLLCRQGVESLSQNNANQALAQFNDCLLKGNLSLKSQATTWRNIGVAHNRLREYEFAINAFGSALALAPMDSWIDLVNRGNSWSGLGDVEKALEDYAQAQQIKPNFADAYFNRGIVFEKQNRLEDAKAQFKLAYANGLRSSGLIERMNVHGLPGNPAEQASMTAPAASMDQFRGFISQLGNAYQGRTLCFPDNSSVGTTRPLIEAELERMGVKGLPSPNQTMQAMFTRFPCPFSSERNDLSIATKADLEGVWLFPEQSQKLRFPPQSPAWAREKLLPKKCEAVAYYPESEARTAVVAGSSVPSCPIHKADDMLASRRNPKVASWNMTSPGKLKITRTDVANHIEEWDVFVVKSKFEAAGVTFEHGDLIAYLRREQGNEFNAATQFRHLVKLP